MTLFIDSTVREAAVVELRDGETIVDRMSVVGDRGHAQQLLVEVEAMMSGHGGLSMIDQIMVNSGPGSFTGVRVGVSIANALGIALNLPVNGQRSPIAPVYDAPAPGGE